MSSPYLTTISSRGNMSDHSAGSIASTRQFDEKRPRPSGRKTSKIVPIDLQNRIGNLLLFGQNSQHFDQGNISYRFSLKRIVEGLLKQWTVMLELTTFTAILILVLQFPVTLAWNFGMDSEEYRKSTRNALLCWAVLIVDIIANFMLPMTTRHYDDLLDANVAHVETDIQVISARYICSWFLVDLLSIVQGIVMIVGVETYAVRVVSNALSLLCVLRVPRLMSRHEQRATENKRNNTSAQGSATRKNAIRIAASVFIFVMLGHYLACGFFHIGKYQELLEGSVTNRTMSPENGTESRLLEDENVDYETAHASWMLAQDIPNSFSFQYVNALYWAITTLVTVGYGDIVPVSLTEKIYSIFVLMFGAVTYAAVFGSVTMLFQNIDTKANRYNTKMDETSEFLRHAALPEKMQKKIIAYTNLQWGINKGFDFDSFLSEFPPPLQVEVKMCRLSGLVRTVPFFKCTSDNFLKELVVCLKHRVCLKNEAIFEMGDTGQEMYFLRKGQLCVVVNDAVVSILSVGAYFGEIGILAETNRTAGVVAEVDSEYYSLHKNDFDLILVRYPEYRQLIVETAERRLERDIERETDTKENLFAASTTVESGVDSNEVTSFGDSARGTLNGDSDKTRTFNRPEHVSMRRTTFSEKIESALDLQVLIPDEGSEEARRINTAPFGWLGTGHEDKETKDSPGPHRIRSIKSSNDVQPKLQNVAQVALRLRPPSSPSSMFHSVKSAISSADSSSSSRGLRRQTSYIRRTSLQLIDQMKRVEGSNTDEKNREHRHETRRRRKERERKEKMSVALKTQSLNKITKSASLIARIRRSSIELHGGALTPGSASFSCGSPSSRIRSFRADESPQSAIRVMKHRHKSELRELRNSLRLMAHRQGHSGFFTGNSSISEAIYNVDVTATSDSGESTDSPVEREDYTEDNDDEFQHHHPTMRFVRASFRSTK